MWANKNVLDLRVRARSSPAPNVYHRLGPKLSMKPLLRNFAYPSSNF